MGLLIILVFQTEDPYVVWYTVNIILLPELSLSDGSKAALVARRWGTALKISTLTTYSDFALLLQLQKVAPTIVWETVVKMLEQLTFFLMVILGTPRLQDPFGH